MPQKRFVRRGVAKIYWLPTVANIQAGPTRAEKEAGLDVTDWIAEMAGFGVMSGVIPTPDMGSRFASSIPGETTVDDSSFGFYDDEITEDIEDAFPIGDEGFAYLLPKGDKPGTPTGALYPSRVSARTPNWTTDMAPATTTVSFAITSEPAQDLVIPPFAAWAATTPYDVGDTVTVTGGSLKASVGGTSGAAMPTAPASVGGTVVDGTVTWVRVA